MAENEEIDGTTARGNEWEVVSLTASAYAAAPGPKAIEQDIEDKSNVSAELEGESSHALFMSRHFAYPVNENLPAEADKSQMQKTDNDKDLLGDLVEAGYKAAVKDEDDCSSKASNLSEESSKLGLYDGKSDKQSISSPELEASKNLLGLNVIEKEENLYGGAPHGYFCEDSPVDEKVNIPDLAKSSERGSDVVADVSEVYTENEKNPDESNLPCEAWWKRQAALLYAHAKETNTLWSIFITAAVMGLVVLGHRWRKEKRQILQVKWHVAVKEEKSGRAFQPISLLKNVIVGGSRTNSFTQGAHYAL